MSLVSIPGATRVIWQFLVCSAGDCASFIAEHEAIVQALQAGESEAAGQAMERHLDAVVTELTAFAQDNPTIFEDL